MKINQEFYKALDVEDYRYDTSAYVWRPTKDNNSTYYYRAFGHTLSCCGVSEFIFTSNISYTQLPALPERTQESLLAKLLWTSAGNVYNSRKPRDNRIMMATTIKFMEAGNSPLDDYYKLCEKIVKKFGFVQLTEPYRNANSGNIITVLVGQF